MTKLTDLAARINRAVAYPDWSRGPVIEGPRRYDLGALAVIGEVLSIIEAGG